MGSKRRLARKLYFGDTNLPRNIDMIDYCGQLSWHCRKCGAFGPWKERHEHNCEKAGDTNG